MTALPWVYDDGGRALAGFRGTAGDCGVRSIAIADQADYLEVYDALFAYTRQWAKAHPRHRSARRIIGKNDASPRDGVYRVVARDFLLARGWTWHPTMFVGVGTTVHLATGELPDAGRLIVQVSKHWCALIDGVVRDTHDPSREGTRAVYGYWTGP